MATLPNRLRQRMFLTLSYFDIFDFCVTKEEVFTYLHSSHAIDKETIEKTLQKMHGMKMNGTVYYSLRPKNNLLDKRIKREEISRRKIKNVQRILNLLRILPTISYLGISGSLAMKNGDADSDVDIFIITLPHTLWLTRCLVWIILSLAAKQRKIHSQGKDMICVNMIMDRNTLSFNKDRQNIYTAHEIVQVVPIINKHHTYELFLQSNRWILNYLANSFEKKEESYHLPKYLSTLPSILFPIELLLQTIQLLYLKRHKTTEQATSTFIAFHPNDYSDTILKAYEKRIAKYTL